MDLFDLPQIVHHEGDAGPYLTAAISFAGPAAETWNCAYNRLMIKARDTTSIHLTLGKHLWEFQQVAEARGEPLPLALVIGVHPAIALGALAIGSIDEDERPSWGPPRRAARAGHVRDLRRPRARPRRDRDRGRDPAPARTPEGPFGEFTGYSLGERSGKSSR